MKQKHAISPTKEEDYPEWYIQVIKEADLAEHSAVRGAMVIKPWGFAIWENIQKNLDQKFKELGVQNAYFPLLIPLSFFEKEAKHVEGFAKECAVVTHHRLEKTKEGNLVPSSELEEPLVIRPTSEMIIGHHFAKWVQSYRDLPLKINQWANIVRWEMRTRLFLRTSEILWQEGHTAHASAEEADEMSVEILHLYQRFMQEYLAIPVIIGEKTESEKFPGAEKTYTLEAMMQDRKALQAGTSHFLGQNFSKGCDISFQDPEGEKVHAWTTSWGVTTRLIGALIMCHSDNDGLVLPPKVAPSHIVILPVLHNKEKAESVLSYCKELKRRLEQISFQGENLRVLLDERDIRGGEKNWGWVKKGVPIRIEIGPRDIEQETIMVMKRDQPSQKEKQSESQFLTTVTDQLISMQSNLFENAKQFQEKHITSIEDKQAFYKFFSSKSDTSQGFARVYFCLDPEIEQTLKQELNVTVRCIPFESKNEVAPCIFTGKQKGQKVIFAKAY